MSDEKTIDYAAVLADLENDLAELEISIDYIRRKKLGAQPEDTDAPIAKPHPSRSRVGTTSHSDGVPLIRQDAFFGMGLVEATKKYLGMTKRPKSSRDIATALVQGGLHTTAKDFYNTVFGVLNREAKNNGEIVKVKKEWGLAEWYPGLRRGPKAARTQDEEEAQAPSVEAVFKPLKKVENVAS